MAVETEASALFAYGSLQLDVVMEAVTGRRFTGRPAVLPGHRRRVLAARSYPGVVADARESTDGVLFRGLDPRSIEILDLFEGEPYERRRVAVRCGDAPSIDAYAYVVRDEHAALMTAERWDLGAFRDRRLNAFLEQCRRFREEVAGGGRWSGPA